jgi:hypothetical protein
MIANRLDAGGARKNPDKFSLALPGVRGVLGV